MKLTRKQTLLVGQETTQGTAVSNVAANDYLEVMNLKQDSNLERLKRLVATSTLDKRADVIGKRYRMISFDVEAKGPGAGASGVKTTAGFKALSALLEACQMNGAAVASNSIQDVTVTNGGTGYAASFDVTFAGGGGTGALGKAIAVGGIVVAVFMVTPGTGYSTDPTPVFTAGGGSGSAAGTVSRGGTILYTLVSDPASGSYAGPGKSVTIDMNLDGRNRQMVGCLGTVSGKVGAGGYPILTFELLGSFSAATELALPAVGTNAVKPERWHGQKVCIAGFASPVISKFEFALNAKVSIREDGRSAGAIKGFISGDRDPSGSAQIEAETVSTFDIEGAVLAATEAPTAVEFGSTIGVKFFFYAPKTQLLDPKEVEREIFLDDALAIKINGNAGNDSMQLLFT